MLELLQKPSFKRKLKKYKHNKPVLLELEFIVELLVKQEVIPVKYKDHELIGNYKGVRELHLKPDDLLLYVKVEQKSITLIAIGSHSEIFK